MKSFRRKITPEYVRKHYDIRVSSTYETYLIGTNNDINHVNVYIQIREDRICLMYGYFFPSYWICDIEHIYELKQMLKIYKIK